ncbi:MAG TPA: dihydrolipoyl dehydrogenase [Candidatus Thermoplasmatota archaeon]|nr:dihydrolipoyl dehydrogenase [Candidatus Thermoplasmatota archaeon]
MHYDLVVVGSGSGLDVANWAAEAGWTTAIVEEGRLGGTCLNRGCIPSKLLIHSADVAETIRRAHLFGIIPKGYEVDFAAIVRRVTGSVDGDSDGIERALATLDNPRLYKGRGRFVGPRRLEVAGEVLTADRFLLAHGARPRIPDIDGLNEVPYLTSTEALRLDRQPRSLAILGGGFIACELGHFFSALGTEVTILQRRPHLLPEEDGEVSRAFTDVMRRRGWRLLTGHDTTRVRHGGDGFVLDARSRGDGTTTEVRADALLVATGVVPNSDRLDVAKAGVQTDPEGYVLVDEHLKTSAEGVWALGDAVGRYLLKHNANHEASYAFYNMQNPGDNIPVDYHAMPHAVFASPQVAAVGATEEELRARDVPYLVGRWRFRETAMGHALEDEDGFVKLLVAPGSGKILGCHILGPEASTLLHEVVVAMKVGDGSIENVTRAVHIHPALSEVVQRAAASVGEG